MADCVELLEAAEAKAYYGIAINWKPLQALTQALLDRGVLQGKEVAHILETNGVIHFPDPFTEGFAWDEDGTLQYPFKADHMKDGQGQQGGDGELTEQAKMKLSGVAGKTWFAGTDMDVPRDADGKLAGGWHWNMPYAMKRELPDWYKKEVARYAP